MKVAWVGDGNNVLHDLMLACAMLGIDIHYAIPEGYEPSEEVVKELNLWLQRIAVRWLLQTTL